MDGHIYLIVGPMFSGKTSELVRIYKRKVIEGSRCILIKYANDQRYDLSLVATHDNIEEKIKVMNTMKLFDLRLKSEDYDDIFIDEIQFYPDKVEFCDSMADKGVNIYACGLASDYLRNPFQGMAELYAKAFEIKSITAVCDICKRDNSACYTKRTVESDQLILIGEHDI